MISSIGYPVLLTIIAWLAWLLHRARTKLARYQSIDDDTADPLLRVDLNNYRALACNPSFAALLGYSSPAECIQLFNQYLHLREYTFHKLHGLIRKKPRTLVPAGMMDRQGDLVTAELEIVLANGGDLMELRPKPRQRAAVPVDLDQLPLPCFQLELSLAVVRCNKAAREYFGWTEEKVAGRKLGDLVFPGSLATRLESIYQRRLERKDGLRLKHATLINQGEIVHCQWEVAREPGANIAAAFCLGPPDPSIPVSALQDWFSGYPWELDTRTGRIEQHPAWLAFLGYDALPETTQLSFWQTIVYPEDQPMLKRCFREIVQGDTATFKIRYRLTSSNGVEHWVETSGTIKTLATDGKPRRVHGIHRDVTDEVYGGGIGLKHDIANQLATVSGYADLALQSELLPRNLKTYMHEIAEAGKKAQSLLQGSNHSESRTEIVHAFETLRRQYGVSISHRQPLSVWQIKESDLLEILEPICVNARDATANKGKVILETGTERLDGSQACSTCGVRLVDSYHWFRVHDQGEGIAPDHLSWVFTPGFTTRGISRQRGHGLSQSDGQIHQLGGHIRLQSSVGEGTWITVYLPETPPAASYSGHSTQDHVLIVDDEPSVVRYLGEVLGQQGYNVTTSTDPCQALTMFQDDPDRFSLVVTDQTMPGLPGDCLTRTMLETRPDLPVIICTGYSETMGVSAARELGARGYIRKPIDADKLLAMISESLYGDLTPG